MLIRRLYANAAVLPAVTVRLAALEAELPEGRTRDVVEQAKMKLVQAEKLLSNEAAALERYAAEL